MLILDATTKSLEVKLAGAVSANELPVTAHYTDITTTLYTPGSNDTQTNGATAATIVAAPGASTQRHVESISVYNADTAAATVTIQLNNNSTLRIITKVTLQAGEQLFYEDGMGWQIIDANGAVIRGTNVSDTAYASSWDGVTTIAPSKNAVYDQMILQMLKNGSNLAIGSDADGDMYYRASSALARLPKGAALAIPRMNSGATAPEWGGAGQIVFPATQNASADANTLDDYEEGTWTPVAKFGTDDPTSVTAAGSYTKIGNLVFIYATITLTTIGAAAGDLNITGLPFNPAAITAFSFSFFQVTPTGAIVGRALSNGTINIYSIATSGTRTTLNNTHFGNGSSIYISGCYLI